jgi:hypothetical protein
MLSKISLVLVALQASLAVAGNAIVSNRCPYDIWLFSTSANNFESAIHIPARSQHSEPFSSSPTSLKISNSSQLVGGAHTQFEYSLINNQIWYDISFVDCAKGQSAGSCPGHDLGLAIDSNDSKCGKIDCKAGSYCPTQVYYVDQPKLKMGIEEPVFTCPGAGSGMDLYMKVCSGEASLKRSIAGRLEMSLDG